MAMKLKLLELTDDKARILFEGEGNTYVNALAAELINDPGVDVAHHKQAFQFSDPELVVTTIGGRPMTEARYLTCCSRLNMKLPACCAAFSRACSGR